MGKLQHVHRKGFESADCVLGDRYIVYTVSQSADRTLFEGLAVVNACHNCNVVQVAPPTHYALYKTNRAR